MTEYIDSESSLDLFVQKRHELDYCSLFKNSGKRTLVLMACHPDSTFRMNFFFNNFNYYKKYKNIDIVVINSINPLASHRLKHLVSEHCIYMETENSNTHYYGNTKFKRKSLVCKKNRSNLYGKY